MTFLHQDCRFRLVEAKHQANGNDSFDDSGVWRGKSKLMRCRPLLWDWQSNRGPRTSHVSTTVYIIIFYLAPEKSHLCQLRGTGALLVLTFLTSAVANRVANRILLARDSNGPQFAGSLKNPSFQVPMAKHSLFLSLATSAAQFLFRDT